MMVISHVACVADNTHMSIFAAYILHLCVIMTVTVTVRMAQMTFKLSVSIMLALRDISIVFPNQPKAPKAQLLLYFVE